MELTAGLGSVDDYIRYIEAGADECFCGYIPYAWDRKYGTVLSLNRREVRCCSVQLGAFSELEILAAMVRAYQKPVQLTFNSLYYLPQQYPEIAETIQKCMEIGFEDYIIADPALILYLRQQKIGCRISLSGEVGEINSAMTGLFEQMEISRIIFPRKMRPEDMAVVAQACTKRNPRLGNMEYEALAFNELCQFSGTFRHKILPSPVVLPALRIKGTILRCVRLIKWKMQAVFSFRESLRIPTAFPFIAHKSKAFFQCLLIKICIQAVLCQKSGIFVRQAAF